MANDTNNEGSFFTFGKINLNKSGNVRDIIQSIYDIGLEISYYKIQKEMNKNFLVMIIHDLANTQDEDAVSKFMYICDKYFDRGVYASNNEIDAKEKVMRDFRVELFDIFEYLIAHAKQQGVFSITDDKTKLMELVLIGTDDGFTNNNQIYKDECIEQIIDDCEPFIKKVG